MINFVSDKRYTNRYRDTYWFERVDSNVYSIQGELKHWRCGGMEGEDSINSSNYGMIDPAGGPFLSPNYFSIDGQMVIRIFSNGENFCFEVE